VSRFLQLHVLTDYPPSNPNRDDLGKPKSAIVGGAPRQRISSQAIKRAIRTSDVFQTALAGKLGDRTQRMGEVIIDHLTKMGADSKKAEAIAREIAGAFGKIEDKKDAEKVRIRQLAFVSPDERALALALADKAMAGEAMPKEKELAKLILQKADGAVDVAMFGRMLADNPDYNREAAVQVSHAFTTNQVRLEDDYYTAVDDLKEPSEDMGAGFVGEAGFGSGVYYLYVCVNRPQLVENLGGDVGLAQKGLEALARAAAMASPSGKKNSFANHTRAGFVLAEKGTRQPRSLASAFTNPVTGSLMAESVRRLKERRAGFANIYGQDWDAELTLDVEAEATATLDELAGFCGAGLASS
jgi:CRISPR system Cascade subunit CasC